MKRLAGRLVFASVGAVAVLAAFGGTADADSSVGPLREVIGELRVAKEDQSTYVRAKFKHWTDADGDGCNSRSEALLSEAVVDPDVEKGCKLRGGRWYSYYDGKTHKSTGTMDMDHFVPLAEAWDSGAAKWSAKERERLANDIGDPRSLVGVTDSVNIDKGGDDPAGWLPPLDGVHCRYVTEWAAVKTRWRLSVDSTEKKALNRLAGKCSNVMVRVQIAR